MRPERWLIAIPALIVVSFAQAVLWVPSYEHQGRANPSRLRTFIEGSSGDAEILNPLLNADTASARVAGLVFDGLLDLDEDLALRPRLAESWRISERAYVLVDEHAGFADGRALDGAALRDALRRRLAEAEPGLVLDASLTEPRTERVEWVGAQGRGAAARVRMPARVRLDLARVVPDLEERIAALLGPGYGNRVRDPGRVEPEREGVAVDARRLRELIPVVEHNPVVDFTLRRAVAFHDGHEFDAGDVRFTYQAIMDPANLSPRRSDFEPIKTLETPSPYHVRVVYKRLFSPALNAWTIGILPEHLLAPAQGAPPPGGMRAHPFNRHPIGTGAFRFVEWQSDELIHLRRNQRYWDGPPLYADYYFRVIPDPLTQEVEFRGGSVDTYAPQPHQVARYRHDPRYRAFSSPGFGYTYIGYNNRNPLFADPRVRRALGMAIDTDSIIAHLLYGEGVRTTGPYPVNTGWYDRGVDALPHDPGAASRLLAEAGWRRGADGWLERDGRRFEFNLITNNGNPLRKAVLTVAQNAWRRIGVKANTQVFEWAVFLEDFVNPAHFDAVILGWVMGADPDLYQIWHSSQAGPNQLNFVGYRNPEADRLMERIRREYDPDTQRALAHRLHRLIARDQPYTFLYAPRSTRVLDRKIVMIGPDGSSEPPRASRSGDPFFFMNRWIKLAGGPRMAPR